MSSKELVPDHMQYESEEGMRYIGPSCSNNWKMEKEKLRASGHVERGWSQGTIINVAEHLLKSCACGSQRKLQRRNGFWSSRNYKVWH